MQYRLSENDAVVPRGPRRRAPRGWPTRSKPSASAPVERARFSTPVAKRAPPRCRPFFLEAAISSRICAVDQIIDNGVDLWLRWPHRADATARSLPPRSTLPTSEGPRAPRPQLPDSTDPDPTRLNQAARAAWRELALRTGPWRGRSRPRRRSPPRKTNAVDAPPGRQDVGEVGQDAGEDGVADRRSGRTALLKFQPFSSIAIEALLAVKLGNVDLAVANEIVVHQDDAEHRAHRRADDADERRRAPSHGAKG